MASTLNEWQYCAAESYCNDVTDNGANGKVSVDNSTDVALGISGVFTGVAEDVSQFSEITVSYNSDALGAFHGLSMEFSPDGVNWDRVTPITPESEGDQTGIGGSHVVIVLYKYFRVVYTNGTDAQTFFRLQTIFHKYKSGVITTQTDTVVNRYNDVQFVRVINDYDQDRARGLTDYSRTVTFFGMNKAVGTTAETVWPLGGTYVWPTTAETVRVAAGGNAADVFGTGAGAWVIRITGLDENWDEVSENINLAGASASASSVNTYYRVNLIQVIASGTYATPVNTGLITLENTTSLQNIQVVEAGAGQTTSGFWTIPNGESAYNLKLLISGSSSNSLDISLYIRINADDFTPPFAPAFLIQEFEDFNGAIEASPRGIRGLNAKTDVWWTAAKTSGGGSTASIYAALGFELITDDTSL